MKNNILVNCDTDSIMIAKPDGSPWTEEEQEQFLEELNSQFPELIKWEHDGVYTSVVVVKSKNYALLPEGENKIKLKGSSMKDAKKEPILREFMSDMIEAMIYHRMDELTPIYHKYVQEALNVREIRKWCSKKTLTSKIFDCKGYTQADITSKKLRKNETDVWDAIKNEVGSQEGDKVYLYPTILDVITVPGGVSEKTGKPLKDKTVEITGLKMDKYWDQDHDVEKLVSRVYSTLNIFKKVLNMDDYTNYSSAKYFKLIKEGKSLSEIDLIYKQDLEEKKRKAEAKALKNV